MEKGVSFINKIIEGDALEVLLAMPDNFVDCVVTSPPYWALRDYGVREQLGLEETFEHYLSRLLAVFDEVERVLKDEGTCFVNLGDVYGKSRSGLNKSLLMMPSRFALAMLFRGWLLRNEIIWHKPNAMPQSARDRFTVDFEKVFFFVRRTRYYFKQLREPHKPESLERVKRKWNGNRLKGSSFQDMEINRMCHPDGRNMRTVWSINAPRSRRKHYASYPEELVTRIISAGAPEGSIVLDPFVGSGTTCVVAKKLGRRFVGIDVNGEYVAMARKRAEAVNG